MDVLGKSPAGISPTLQLTHSNRAIDIGAKRGKNGLLFMDYKAMRVAVAEEWLDSVRGMMYTQQDPIGCATLVLLLLKQ